MITNLRAEQRTAIFQAIQVMYTQVAQLPDKVFHFPTGRAACVFVGYPETQLDAIPSSAVESFAGVGYPFAGEAIYAENRVLDVGSGSGTDALIASMLVGHRGKVWGVDRHDRRHAGQSPDQCGQGAGGADRVSGGECGESSVA